MIGLTRNMEATSINTLPVINEYAKKVNSKFLVEDIVGGTSGSTNIAFVPISVFKGSPKRLEEAIFGLT
ncbi:hypothetical protein D3C86_2044540 [compost metagenome]